MAQAVSYGSITIVDTNDIEEIYMIYAGSNNSDSMPTFTYAAVTGGTIWKRDASQVAGNYIWQSTVVTKSGVDITSSNWTNFYGVPVCITGPEGADARKIISVIPYYYLSTSNTNQTGGSWNTTPAVYPSTGTSYYWTKTVTTYDSGSPTESTPVLNMALTNAAKDSRDANSAASQAVSIATDAQENSEGALSQANSNINEVVRLWQAKSVHSTPNPPSTEVTTGSASTYNNWSTVKPTATDTYRYFYYCDQSKTGGGICTWSEVIEDTSYLSTYEINALNVRTKNFFKGKDATYDGWFASGRTEDEGLRDNDAETYLYNARFAATNIALGYNKTPVINLDGSNGTINIYRLPTIDANTKKVTKVGALGMQLGASSLNFYEPPVGNADPTIAATLSSTGLNIADGSIILGGHGATGINNGDIALSNSNFTRTINGVSRADLRFAIGSKFGVKNDGTLYASNATISGTITVGSGSDLSAGLSAYSTTSQMNSAINTATDDMATKTYVTNQGYQTATDVNGAINTATANLATKDNAVYRTQQIYRRYTAAQSNLSGPTTWVTTSTNIYNNWTTKIPPLTSGTTKYPYLYTAIQTQTIKQYNGGSGTTCTCTSVLLDDTTTIIDGGSIIAGSVTANEITGSKLSAIYADMGTITAGNITKGYNSINFDNTPATLEFKNASSWSTATQGIKYDSSGLAIKGAIIVTSGSDLSAGLTNYSTTAQISNTYSTKADSVKRTQRIYYYAPSEGEGEESTESETLSAPETPNDWISASSGVETWINQRIEEVPASSGSGTEPLSVENYPNVWVSEQTEMVNGDINCTPPKLDSISSIALDAQDLVNSLSDTINGENGLSEAIRLLTGSIIINPGDFTQTPPIEPSITIQTNSEEEGAETGKAALTLTSTQLILEKNNDAVITLDSTQDDGAIEANEIILNSGLRIGNLEIIPYNGGIGIRAWEVEE